MPTTRRARAAQSEDTQSPLRALEMEPKSRKKVSRAPKKIGKKVSDDKVTKKKPAPKRPTKRATKKPTKSTVEIEDHESVNGSTEDVHDDLVSEHPDQDEAAALTDEHHDEEEDLETQETQESQMISKENTEEPPSRDASEAPEVSEDEEMAAEEEEDDDDSAPEQEEPAEQMQYVQDIQEIIVVNSDNSSEQRSAVAEDLEEEVAAVQVIIPAESSPHGKGSAIPAYEDSVTSPRQAATDDLVILAEVTTQKTKDPSTTESSNAKVFVSTDELLDKDEDDQSQSFVRDEDDISERASTLFAKPATEEFREGNAASSEQTSVEQDEEVSINGSVTGKIASPSSKSASDNEDEDTDLESESESDSGSESEHDQNAEDEMEVAVTQSPGSGQTPGENNDEDMETEENREIDKQDAKENVTTPDPQGSWLRRSIARVNPLSWFKPSSEPRRKPLQEAKGTLLNTPTPSRAQRLPQTERVRRASMLAGQSLGFHKATGAERARARQLQAELRRREAELASREEALRRKETKIDQDVEERENKRKRSTTPSTGGRSTYSFDDASPMSIESRSPSYLSSSRATDKGASDADPSIAMTTPTRQNFTSSTPSQTPLFSILRRSVNEPGSEPAAKRLRTGSRSVIWKAQIEEDSPIEKHSPPTAKKFVPRTPYVPGTMFSDTERILRSAQKPSVSRTTFSTQSKYDSRALVPRTEPVPRRSANTIFVPYDSSDDEDEEMPETPSKVPPQKVNKPTNSTPVAEKTMGSATLTPPAPPHPAHATLPAATSSITTPMSLSSSSSLNGVGPGSPRSPLMAEEQQEHRLSKARERANQFTPKQPSRLRESESTDPSARQEPKATPESPLSVNKFINKVLDNGKLLSTDELLRTYLERRTDTDPAVIDAAMKVEVSKNVLSTFRPLELGQGEAEIQVDAGVQAAINTVWNGGKSAEARQGLAQLDANFKEWAEAHDPLNLCRTTPPR